ncbi:MAG: PQQ-binding-like beta-propeller repeat protein [Planctomycetes bacterium]|nr:PQQ-binding-like beta-propeller repeat protein [Planctomycetota bacterium]
MKKLIALLLVLFFAPAAARTETAQELLGQAGVSLGLIVHVGCGSGAMTAELLVNDHCLVQGLDADAENIRKARELALSRGLSGKLTFDQLDPSGQLPYIDNLVNLVVAEQLGPVPLSEVVRVLRPGGVALIKQQGRWTKKVKPWPEELDEWTHYLHDPQGTALSHDRAVGHPRGLQWTGGPLWARSHEHTASLQAMVSAAGRVFYVFDEGPTESIQLPPKFMLTARDAFNGVVLWKRPLHDWFNPLFPLKSGPGWMPRRLVAVGDRVYIAPGIGQELLCLDAATGKQIRAFPGTATTFEVLVSDGLVFAAVDPDRTLCDYRQENANCWKERERASKRWGWYRDRGQRLLKVFRADDGKLLWQREMPVTPMTLTADSRMVCFHDGQAVIALDRQNGQMLWKTNTLEMDLVPTGYSGPRLVLYEDKVLFSPKGHIFALDAYTGQVLWTVKNKPRSGHYSLEDFYVMGDRIWVLGRPNNGVFVAYSLQDGRKLEQHRNPIQSFYIHQRCYPGRATERFLLPPMMGVMLYDLETDQWFNNHWVRGGCFYGLMPANGMIYVPPHACACYYQSKLNGFNALSSVAQSAEAPPAAQRLTKGPAYGVWKEQSKPSGAEWPTFRHDNLRSGYARTDVAADLEPVWKKDFGVKLSQPVVADGKLLITAVDRHTVYALDAKSGRELWHFVAGGRVNSPPTLYHGLAFFGCADGNVYALDAADGRLAWRFQAAPNARKLVSYGQLESVWPLFGSVLIQDGKLYCVAGRSLFLDGGLRLLILDPKTGKLIFENVMDRHVPGKDKLVDDLLMGKHMPVAQPDILSSDGQYVYMKSQTFTLDGHRVRIRPQRPDTQYDEEVHLFSPISFLDDAWHQRTYWIYGRAAGEGWAEFQFPFKRVPCGRILCFDENNAYAYARDPELMCNTSVSEYRLYCADKFPARKVGIPRLEGKWIKGRYPTDNPLAPNSVDWKRLSQLPMEKLTALNYHWVHEEPEVIAKAMVLANERLFVAGPKDVADEKALWGRSNEKVFQEKMAEQLAWLNGEHGGILQVLSKKDGSKLAEYRLEDVPAFDGMIAANGRLFLVMRHGSLVCYAGP